MKGLKYFSGEENILSSSFKQLSCEKKLKQRKQSYAVLRFKKY